MRKNDNIVFIDHKGVSHNMRVESFREHRDGKGELIHDEPLVTGNYNMPPTGEPMTLIDIQHISHPQRQDNNPELPSYPLHAWKYEEEEHLELPADHPVHDHFNEQPKLDGQGKVIPKSRPHYEAHIWRHREQKATSWNQVVLPPENDGLDALYSTKNPGVANPDNSGLQVGTSTHGLEGSKLPASVSAAARYLKVGDLGHPETIHFDFDCQSCGEPVQRVAHHQGGTMWEKFEASAEKAVQWVKHVCDPVKARAFSHKLNPPKEAVAVEVTTQPIAEHVAEEKKLPVLSVLYTSPDTSTYQGVKLVLPDGYEHIVKHNGIDQDTEDAIRFAQVHGFPEVSVDQTIVNFREDLANAKPAHEPDVIAELENAPPAPEEPKTPPPADAA